MKTLSAIILATAIGTVGCGWKPYETKEQKPLTKAVVVDVVGIPLTTPMLTPSAHSSAGSFTFYLKTSVPKKGVACAYRFGPDAREETGNYTNQQLEFEASTVELARHDGSAVAFLSNAKTPQGCYVINAGPTIR